MINRLEELGLETHAPSWSIEENCKPQHDLEHGPWTDEDLDDNDEPNSNINADVTRTQRQRTGEMTVFFSHVEYLQTTIYSIGQAAGRIDALNEQYRMATTASRETEISSELEPVLARTNSDARRSKEILGLLREDNSRAAAVLGNNAAGDLRIRENLVNTLTRRFVAHIKLYQNAQKNYRADIKDKVRRQVQAVQPEATEEQIDAVMQPGGEGVEGLIRKTMLTGVADPIKNAYSNVAERYNDVLTLEASVAELHQMFLDFALLVEHQGEMLDQIEHQVKKSTDYVYQGNANLLSSIEIQKRTRSKQCKIIIIIAAIVGIVVSINIIFR